MPSFFDIELKLSDKVYEPAEDTELAIAALLKLLEQSEGGLSILDMGCGTGIIGLFAAKSEKVKEVVMADISDAAIKLAKENVASAGIKEGKVVKVVKSDLFSNIEGSFDIIVFNAPYLPEERDRPEDAVMLSGGKEGVELSIRFLTEALHHLKPSSYVVLVSSSLSNLSMLHDAYKRLGYKIAFSISKHIFFEDILADVLIVNKNKGYTISNI